MEKVEQLTRQLKMIQLRAQGLTYKKIAAKLGVSAVAVQYNCNPQCRRQMRESARRYRASLHPRVIAMLGGKCAACGTTDLRDLQINHINHGGSFEVRHYPSVYSFYLAILRGERSTEDLEVLCANCNAIYEYQKGRVRPTELHTLAVKILGGKCEVCNMRDIRALQINHKEGIGRRDAAKYKGNGGLHQAIVNGTRGTKDLNVLCVSCNRIYEYEKKVTHNGQ